MTYDSNQARFDKERAFHDHWALTIDVEKLHITTCFEGATSPENRFILSHLGNISGKTILDLGCGAGENGIYFALKGGCCIAGDYSPLMVNTALQAAEKHGVTIEGKVLNAEQLDYPDDSFDIVYASNLLHHVNPRKALREMYRVLKPGGKACFWDPLKHNPIINVYRRIAKNVRTEVDEYPLHIHIIKDVQALFSTALYDTFLLASLWIFLSFYLIERVDPNTERYWKKIIVEEQRLRQRYLTLERFDMLLKKIPFMKRYAWNIAVVAMK